MKWWAFWNSNSICEYIKLFIQQELLVGVDKLNTEFMLICGKKELDKLIIGVMLVSGHRDKQVEFLVRKRGYKAV